MNVNFAILEADGKNLFVNLMLAIGRSAVLPLGTVDKCRVFGVEAMEAVRLLVHEGVILRHKLPADF